MHYRIYYVIDFKKECVGLASEILALFEYNGEIKEVINVNEKNFQLNLAFQRQI